MSVDWTKPIQTDIGYKAEYLLEYHFRNGKTRIVIIDTGEHSFPESFYENGSGGTKSSMNIINVPPRKEKREVEAWAAVDADGMVVYISTQKESAGAIARSRKSHHRLVRLTGTYEVEVEE